MQNVNITMRILSCNALPVVELETSPLTFEGSRCRGQQPRHRRRYIWRRTGQRSAGAANAGSDADRRHHRRRHLRRRVAARRGDEDPV